MRNKKLTQVTTNNKITEQVMRPAIIFGKNTAPTVEQIKNTANDPDYAIKFARVVTKSDDESSGITTEVIHPYTASDSALLSLLTSAANDKYRNAIESNPNHTAVRSINAITSYALNIASNKFCTALHQNILYCIADSVSMFTAALESDRNIPTGIANIIRRAFSTSEYGKWDMNMGRYIAPSYLEAIGDAYNAGTDEAFNNATIIIYNSIMSDVMNTISNITSDAHGMICNILYSADSSLDVNDASTAIVWFNDIMCASISAIIDVIKDNAFSLLNDIILIASTMYANADIDTDDYFSISRF